MGTDCAPFVANLVLYKMERDWIHKKLANNEYEKLAHFRYAKRYIDDLLLVNNRNQIELAKDEIYGADLVLKRTNPNNDKGGNFLDTQLDVVSGRINRRIYDKRDEFNFEIVKFPSFPSNVPFGNAHNLLSAQLTRFARISYFVDDFFRRTKQLTRDC